MNPYDIPSKKMYRVEKFLPTQCPKCRVSFDKETTVEIKGDWTRLLGDIVNGEKVIRETKGYDIIICAHCGNYTARVLLESYQLSSREKAEELIKKEGFVNLLEVTAFGNNKQDSHTVYAKMPGIEVMSIKCE